MEKIVNALIAAIEIWDPYTAGHQKRVATLSLAIAREMEFNQKQLDTMRIAAILHDIGKINLPTEILCKPGKLATCEYNLIKIHSEAGYQILKKINFPDKIAEIIYQHHETLDGKGYPRGLKADDISIEARILRISDVVEAISANRPYRPANGIEDALGEIENDTNGKYDKDICDVCINLFRVKNFKIKEIQMRDNERTIN
ncbi:MAG: HD domain-containing protein [Candidatus Cloacimonetes bacterium]|jgi:putative two-component system response regulator|nr:HD domain-containing protein [Candidatus Cloacimonadota bacterium]MBT4576009.1 HD domain-containing protein [Candidatus Cloacimonadota bacterium]